MGLNSSGAVRGKTMKRWIIGSIMMFILIAMGWAGFNPSVDASGVQNRNPMEWMDKLETDILGVCTSGSPLERLVRFEEFLVGRVRDGGMVQRMGYLENLLYVNQPYDFSINYKIQALEWVVLRRVYPETLAHRVERLEKTLFGTVYSGPIAGRTEKLVSHVFPEGVVKSHWVSVLAGLPVKVKLLDDINSKKNKTGDTFRFEVVETVESNNMIIIPQGAVGTGCIAKVVRPRRLGIDARLMLDFKEIRVMDNTPLELLYGLRTTEISRPRRLAVGASTAGMLMLGPEGILIGMMIKGKERILPAQTELMVQVKKPARIHALEK